MTSEPLRASRLGFQQMPILGEPHPETISTNATWLCPEPDCVLFSDWKLNGGVEAQSLVRCSI